jgi:hypothetical protein
VKYDEALTYVPNWKPFKEVREALAKRMMQFRCSEAAARDWLLRVELGLIAAAHNLTRSSRRVGLFGSASDDSPRLQFGGRLC